MTGTDNQNKWAELIKKSVHSEFDRVTNALRQAAERQRGQDQLDTLAIIAILEEKRTETLANENAGYFIRVWAELSDQVRKLLTEDPRYKAKDVERRARKQRKS